MRACYMHLLESWWLPFHLHCFSCAVLPVRHCQTDDLKRKRIPCKWCVLQAVGYHYVVAWLHAMPSSHPEDNLAASASTSLNLLQGSACGLVKQRPGQPRWRLLGITSAMHAAAAVVENVQQLPPQVSTVHTPLQSALLEILSVHF